MKIFKRIMENMIALFVGMTISSLWITKSDTWEFSVPVLLGLTIIYLIFKEN